MLRSLVWTIARRLPGVWWAKSTTTKLTPSIVITIPRRMSVALIIMAYALPPGMREREIRNRGKSDLGTRLATLTEAPMRLDQATWQDRTGPAATRPSLPRPNLPTPVNPT